ncbi:MAG: M23 family metallopeptidase [Endomicrobium sp.]|jgi:murein DD-endopeptidase MepM/ murein hydrolase activator NlpD|uniref:M23 family metallopeptidase n=1 Tax=Candidatus Endomicrobiellum cubanum TaxID=3242325 RepID=UPI002823DE93|nr:M23 family metallopeptidase [Endomicrobium sp.]MDR2395650.1 M23 family metallopeptidase [Endomicrobium sp.]
MNILEYIKQKSKKRFSILFVSYDKRAPFSVNVSLLFVCVCLFLWTITTAFSGYIVVKHFDYIKTKTEVKAMQIKLLLFTNQLNKTKSILEKLQSNDEKIRSLLSLNAKEYVLEEGFSPVLGKGGPAFTQMNMATTILSGNLDKVDYTDLMHQSNSLYEQHRFMLQSQDEVITYIYKQKSIFLATPYGWPCEGRISSVYGFRVHPIFRVRDFHSGIDIANVTFTPIICTADGRVVFSGKRSGYGNILVIDHGCGYRTVYAHLAKNLVKAGENVTRGQLIAKMGSTGSSTGPHLHYEVHFKGKTVNPKPYLTGYFFNKR